jgi:DMSO/TMAO reductase YedYZ molybdopterin-dependent catalytic subunit
MHNETDPPQTRRSATSSTWAGPAVVVFSLGVAELVAGFSGRWRSPILAVGDAFIDRTPRWLKEIAIDWFGTNDKIALLLGMAATIAALSVGLGIALKRGFGRGVIAAVGAFGLLGVIAALATRTPAQSSLIPAIAALLAGLVGVVFLVMLGSRETTGDGLDDAADSPIIGLGPNRRQATQALGLLAAGTALGVGGRRLGSSFDVGAERDTIELPTVTRAAQPTTAPTDDASSTESTPDTPDESASEAPATADDIPVDELEPVETLAARAPAIVGLSPLFTPNDDFYRIDTALTVPQVSIDTWTLSITGMVDEPITLTWEDLLERPFVEADITLSCVSNEVGGNLLGTARWLGTRLDTLLESVGVDPNADQIVGRSVDGYTCGFPVDALDGRNALVAIGMNGEPLPAIHGYPARLIVPGLYGYVSATKWLTEIELTRFDEFDSYWVERDWVDDAPIKTQSRIDTPRPLTTVSAGSTPIAGVAWAQTRGITQVEVQVDDGEWVEANLVPAVNDDTWTQWWLDWDATPGRHTITVRATDPDGGVQTDERATPFPSGATGRHEIVVIVS